MKRFILLSALLLCLSALPAIAQETEDKVPAEKTDADAPAPKITPFRADGGLTKAEGQLADGLYMQALETLKDVLKRRASDSDALTYTGYAWYRLGEAKKAREYFERALKYDPAHLGANEYKAELYLDDGDIPRAVEQLQVIRMTCVNADCAEMHMLESAINKAKIGVRKTPPPAKVPDDADAKPDAAADGNQ